MDDSTKPELADEPSLDAAETPSEPSLDAAEKPARRWTKVAGVVALAAVIFLTLVTAVGAWASQRSTSTVPQIMGLPAPVAQTNLEAAKLTPATMATVATPDFDAGVVMDQLPAVGARVVPGSGVDMLVAVTPTPTVTPNVSLETTTAAQAILGRSLLTTVIYQQLSDSVDFGRVVGQIPRAGEPIMTGQPIVVFASLGRGSGGAVVPSVVGKTLTEASAGIAEVYLLTQVYSVYPGMSMSDKVVDQLPAPGAHAPVGSAVVLVTAGSSK